MIPLFDNVPSKHPPLATIGLISVCVLVFLYELSLDQRQLTELLFAFGLVPGALFRPEAAQELAQEKGLPALGGHWALLTSLFLHGGWLHLIGNMWFLYLFGDNVEDRTGPTRFVLFFLTCGVIAGAVHALTATGQALLMPTMGASGAVAGVIGGYVLLYPRAQMVVLVPIIIIPLFVRMPAIVFAFIWFGIQFLNGLASLSAEQAMSGVAWWAHLGGLVAGLLLLRLFVIGHPPGRGQDDEEHGFESAWSD